MNCAEILQLLASRPDPDAVEGMARFGIVAKKVYGGWSTPALKKLAREIGRDHALAQELWASEIYEARVLATLIDEPEKVTARQMNQWAKDFDNWAMCDGACINVFRYTRFAHQKCVEWSARRGRVRQKGGVCPDGGPGRGGQSRERRCLSAVPAPDQTRGGGREKHGEERCELGAAADRKTERAAEPGRPRCVPRDSPPGFTRRPLDCLRRPARTAKPRRATKTETARPAARRNSRGRL